MKMIHVIIHSFRGLPEASSGRFEYSLFVDSMCAGESTVIDAARVFHESGVSR